MTDTPTPPDEVHPENFDSAEETGWGDFWAGLPLSADPGNSGWVRGWWKAWARAYALGWAGWEVPDLEDPYPQFSGAWEAWGDGWNDRSARESGRAPPAHLSTLIGAARAYLEDLESGLADGTYDEGAEKVEPIRAAIAHAEAGAMELLMVGWLLALPAGYLSALLAVVVLGWIGESLR